MITILSAIDYSFREILHPAPLKPQEPYFPTSSARDFLEDIYYNEVEYVNVPLVG